MTRPLSLHRMSSLEIVQAMNAEDATVAQAVQQVLPDIAVAVDLIAERLETGGRLFYVGAGTSGRLGALDAYECPPTFGTPPDLTQAIIAGNDAAMDRAVELAEDDEASGPSMLADAGFCNKDVVVGLAASGSTPFVLAAVRYAKGQAGATIGLSCKAPSPLLELADHAISVEVGPEVLAGSTRLKAGTAQKQVLNMLSTATMVRLDKVYENRMVSLQVTNQKLVERAQGIVSELGEVSGQRAADLLQQAQNDVPTALVMARLGLDASAAQARLDAADGHVGRVLDSPL